MIDAEQLREKGRDYELNALAHGDRGDTLSACGFLAAALVFHELANLVDETVEHDTDQQAA